MVWTVGKCVSLTLRRKMKKEEEDEERGRQRQGSAPIEDVGHLLPVVDLLEQTRAGVGVKADDGAARSLNERLDLGGVRSIVEI